MLVLISLCLAVLIGLSSCSDTPVQSVERENLFRLDIGRLEDQIDLFRLEGNRSARKTRIVMRDGIFYISDGNGEKLVSYNSYGDLLSMIYNSETNPPPLRLRTEPADEEIVTRWAKSYPFNEIGELTVDSRRHIYVEDRLPQNLRSYDPEIRSMLDSTILHFDQDGNFMEYLGQEGIGGTAFPRIDGLFSSINDELAVVSQLSVGWNIYWFDKYGNALYLVKIRNTDLPILEENQGRPSLDSIVVSPDTRELYIKIDYYTDTIDESTGTKAGISHNGSLVWIMRVDDGTYTGTVEVPVFERTITENDRNLDMDFIYTMIGAADDGNLFFTVPDSGGYSLLMIDRDTEIRQRGFIQVGDDELFYHTFDLAPSGILSALLASEWDAKLVWWRSDTLMGE